MGADTRFRRKGRGSARLYLRADVLLLALVVVVVAVNLFSTLEGDAQFCADVETLIHIEVHTGEDVGKDAMLVVLAGIGKHLFVAGSLVAVGSSLHRSASGVVYVCSRIYDTLCAGVELSLIAGLCTKVEVQSSTMGEVVFIAQSQFQRSALGFRSSGFIPSGIVVRIDATVVLAGYVVVLVAVEA